jgi:hypothetical protein
MFHLPSSPSYTNTYPRIHPTEISLPFFFSNHYNWLWCVAEQPCEPGQVASYDHAGGLVSGAKLFQAPFDCFLILAPRHLGKE